LEIAIEIVDFPMKHGDFPLFFVCLPEGMFFKVPLRIDGFEAPKIKTHNFMGQYTIFIIGDHLWYGKSYKNDRTWRLRAGKIIENGGFSSLLGLITGSQKKGAPIYNS